MLCGNLMAELLWDHVVSLCFIPDLFVTISSTSTNMHVALNDSEWSDDRRIFYTSALPLTIFKMKTLNGSDVVILDGGLVCNNLGLRAKPGLTCVQGIYPRGHVQTKYLTHHSGLRNLYKKGRS